MGSRRAECALPPEERRKPVQFRLPPALLERVDGACEDEGYTRTEYAERAAEEARGHVRWLRPEFQAPGAIQTSAELGSSDDEEDTADEAPAAVRKRAWPKALPDQLSAVRGEIKTLPQPFHAADLAGGFTGAKLEDVEAALDCLAALGLVLHVEGPDGAPAFAAVDAGVRGGRRAWTAVTNVDLPPRTPRGDSTPVSALMLPPV